MTVHSTSPKNCKDNTVDPRTGEALCGDCNNVSVRTTVRCNSNKSLRGWRPFGSSQTPGAATSTATAPHPMHVTLLNGKEGAGRTSVILWLKAQAALVKIPVVSTKLAKKDHQSEYHVWRKLFQQLMPKDLYQDSATQRSHITVLLRKVYPGQPLLAEHVGYPALKAALGITCSFVDEGSSSSAMPGPNKLSKGNWSQSVSGLLQRNSDIPTSVPLQDTLLKIFAYLLGKEATLVVIEHIEHADEDSLKLLVALLQQPTRSAIALSALMVDDGVRKKARIGKFLLPKSYEKDAFNASVWSKTYREMIQRHRTTTTIVLENYTLTEIEKMLISALGVKSVPPDMPQLVQEFAGGSCFWVREIVRCIKENGSEQFMSAVDGETDPTSVAAPLTGSGKSAMPFFANVGAGATTRERSVRAKPRHNSISAPRGAGSNLRASLGGAPSMWATAGAVGAVTSLRASIGGVAPSSRMSMKSQLTRAASINNLQTSCSQIQLDKLILCRFNSLATDVQRILRTASIVGLTFTGPLLQGILPKHLKVQMSAGIDVLLHQKWLYQDTECDTVYEFAHPHAHKIIYQLTPSSERNNMHQQIADYIEETYGVDKTQFAALSYHYQHCDTDKALMYCVQAVMALNDNTTVLFDFGDCVDLLFGIFGCVKTTHDCDILQQLVRHTILAVDMCYELQQAELRESRANSPHGSGWTGFLFSLVRTVSSLTTRSSISANSFRSHKSSGKYSVSSSKVVPDNSQEDANGVADNVSVGFGTGVSTRFDSETDDGESDGLDDDGTGGDYERKARRTFVSQLERLNDQLCLRRAELACTQPPGTRPSDWQLDYLDLQ
jgi:hypothetical protein